MIKVKDVMTKNVICVTKDTPVIEAITLMAKEKKNEDCREVEISTGLQY